MKIRKFSFQVPGYQEITVEQSPLGVTFLYIGDNYVAFIPDTWARFLQALPGSDSVLRFDRSFAEIAAEKRRDDE